MTIKPSSIGIFVNRDTISIIDGIILTTPVESIINDEVFPTNNCNFSANGLGTGWATDPVALIINGREFLSYVQIKFAVYYRNIR